MSEDRQQPGYQNSAQEVSSADSWGESARSPNHSVTEPRGYESDEISFLDALIVLSKHKKLIFGVPFVAAVITAGITLLMPNIYTARSVLMPPQQQQSTVAAMLGQLGALAGVAGSSLGIQNPNDLYVGMLKSRTVADALIERFELKELYEKETMVETRVTLAKNTSVIGGKDGLIAVEVDDKDPKRAAEMANAYVEQLDALTERLAVTDAAQKRLFFERQLDQAKRDLVAAELKFRKTQESTGLVQIDQQGRAMIEAVATLRAQIVAREVQLASMRSYATQSNPEYVKLQEELASLRAQLSKLERGSGIGGDMLVPTRQIPAAALEYARSYRDVKYAETIFEVMAKQFELAKLEEARDAAVIQVVDKAVAPDKKSKPKRSLIVVMVFALVSGLVVVMAFVKESYSSSPH